MQTEYFLFEKLGTRTASDVKNFGFWNIFVDLKKKKLAECFLSEKSQVLPTNPKMSFQVFVLVMHNPSWSGEAILRLDFQTQSKQSNSNKKEMGLFGFGCGKVHVLCQKMALEEEFQLLGLCSS